MFNENLVESSPALRRRRHWPTFAAFALQLVVAAALLVIPLFYVGVLPQNVRLTTPITVMPVVHELVERTPSGGGGTPYTQRTVLIASNDQRSLLLRFRDPRHEPQTDGPQTQTIVGGGDTRLPPGIGDGPATGSKPRLDDEKKRIRRSSLDEGLLVSKIVPEYPIIAKRTGVQGDVKLHAIIARDGTIQSLNLISGHPLLVVAAMDAVKQWRYRPYYLNGEAVEVETYITVTFRKTN
jgi:protein TonB